MTDDNDLKYMRRALELAARGRATTRPNPMVGCVIVRDGLIVGEGWHERAGEAHAEVHALQAAGEAARGADVYVNLEPCSHHGRTPPCTDALIHAGVRRVVAAMIDPNPRVSGTGLEKLRAHGILAEHGVLERDAKRLNEGFIVHIAHKRPFVTVKLAQSLDGRIATHTGHSRWITGEEARRRTHEMRAAHDAILIGTGTLLADDPRLTTRLADRPDAPTPHRYVIDARLDAALDRRVYDVSVAPTTVMTSRDADPARVASLKSRGVEVVTLASEGDRLATADVLRAIGAAGNLTLLVEGGGELVASLLSAGSVDRLVTMVAPRVIGGRDARPAVGGEGAESVEDGPRFRFVSFEQVGDDLVIVSEPLTRDE